MNVAGVWSGQIETKLTDEGKRQAAASGRKLKTMTPQIDVIMCSPLERAHETAKVIALEIGFPIEKIKPHPILLERNFGVIDGTPSQVFFEKYTRKDLDTVKGAETIEQLQRRAEEAFEYIQTIDADTVLVVGHGTFGRALVRVVKKYPHTDEYDSPFRIGNAEIVELL